MFKILSCAESMGFYNILHIVGKMLVKTVSYLLRLKENSCLILVGNFPVSGEEVGTSQAYFKAGAYVAINYVCPIGT